MSQIRKHGLLFRPGISGFLFRAIVDSLREKQGAKGELIDERWPSHLHINLLPSARDTGLGRALMERWFEGEKKSGAFPGLGQNLSGAWKNCWICTCSPTTKRLLLSISTNAPANYWAPTRFQNHHGQVVEPEKILNSRAMVDVPPF